MSAIRLEAFDATDPSDAPVDQQYEAGFQDGLAEGRALQKAEQTDLTAQMVQAVVDLEFTHAEAMATAIRALDPMIAAFVDQILPDLAMAAFGARLKAEIGQSFRSVVPTHLVIAVHPDTMDTVSAALAQSQPGPRLVADPQLDPLSAVISHGDDAWMIDQGAALSRLQQAVSAAFALPERTHTNG